ncbi:MAG: restriction endonuclease subunit S [Desulfobacteraceae bacterium]|nr:restriction endonuclease subunit S [Desulfobacteraceae bacterium]
MERYEKYKDSGVEWIVEIPEGWEVKKLKYMANTTLGKMLTNSDKGNYKKRKYLRAANIEWLNVNISDVKEMWFSDDELKRLRLEEGDLLVSEGGEVGRTCIWKKELDECYIQNSVHKVTFNSQNNPEYFLNQFFVMGCKGAFDSIVNRISIGHLTGEKLKEICFIKPLLTEQIAIAKYLDRKTAEIDELITQKEWLIEMYEEEKTAIINQAVTKGINPDVETRHALSLRDSGIDWLGEIPEGWELKRLRYVGSCQNGVSKGADYFGSGFPFVSYSDVYKNLSLPQNVDGLAESTEIDRANYSVIKGDVFFTRTSETMEEIGIASTCLESIENAIFSGFLIRFRPFDSILFEGFSKYYFRSQLHRFFFVKEMNLVTRASLSQELLKRLPVILPPIQEQKQITSYLDQETNYINAKIAKTKKIIALQKEYRTALISEVVTGKIKVPQETPL